MGGLLTPYPSWVGADHADDLQYVFGKPFTTPLGYWPSHRDLSDYMIAYWTNFARTGYVYSQTRQETITENNSQEFYFDLKKEMLTEAFVSPSSDPNNGESKVPALWPQFTSASHQYVDIHSKMDASYVRDRMRLPFVQFWTSILPNLPVKYE